MTSYTAALNSYNQDYISNHTLAMQQLSKQIIREVTEGIQGLPSINMHLDNLLLPLQGLLNCFPPNTAAGQTCNLGVIDEIEQTYQLIQHEMKLNIQVAQQSMQAFQNEVKDFVDSVRQALGEADDFFRAVAGTAGVIAWVVSQVDFLNLDTDLCGKSTPDWCHFTSMNWKVPALYIPNLPTFTPMRDASFLWKGLKDAVSQVQLDLQLESLGIKDELIDLFDQVDVSISIDTRFAPDDYHPPKYPAPAPTPAPNQGSGTSTDNYNLSNTTNLSNSPSTGLSDDARRQTQDSNAFRGNITSLYTAEPPVIRPLSLNTTVNITDRFHDSPLQSNGTLIRGNGFASNYIFQPIQYLANQLQSTFSIQWARFQPGPFDFTVRFL